MRQRCHEEDCMDVTTTSRGSEPELDPNTVNRLMERLEQDANSLGKDRASTSVRDGVRALRTAIAGGGSTLAASLGVLDTSVDGLHMSHMQPLFKQALRTLRTALNLDVRYTYNRSARDSR
jgi:hypothetical protein